MVKLSAYSYLALIVNYNYGVSYNVINDLGFASLAVASNPLCSILKNKFPLAWVMPHPETAKKDNENGMNYFQYRDNDWHVFKECFT